MITSASIVDGRVVIYVCTPIEHIIIHTQIPSWQLDKSSQDKTYLIMYWRGEPAVGVPAEVGTAMPPPPPPVPTGASVDGMLNARRECNGCCADAEDGLVLALLPLIECALVGVAGSPVPRVRCCVYTRLYVRGVID